MEIVPESSSESDIVVDEQRIWKKNSKLFYSLLISNRLLWPSLSVEWLRYRGEEKSLGYCTQRLVYSTHTSSQEPEQLIVDAIKLPYDTISDKQSETIAKKDNIITNIVSMAHQGEANRIRVCPTNDYILASKSSNNKIYIYNYENVSKGSDRGLQKLLTGHTEEGFGLSWNNANLLASASNDKLVCYWDCNSNTNEPISTYTYHTASAEDVAWADDYTIASVGDDRKLILADIRSNSIAAEIYTHSAEVNSIDFNKESPGLIITGSSDQTIAGMGYKKLRSPIKKTREQGGSIFC